MNADLERELRQLEEATAAVGEEVEPLDDETVVLRDGWLELNRLLAAANASLERNREPVSAVKASPWSSIDGLRFFAVIAASLAAAFLGWTMLSWHSSGPERPSTVAASSTNGASDIEEASGVSPSTSTADVELAWDDAFDDQIARANGDLWEVAGSPSDRHWDYLNTAFSEFGDELDGGSL